LKQHSLLKKYNNPVLMLAGMLLVSVLGGCSESGKTPSGPVPIAQKPAQQLKTQGTSTQAVVVQLPEYAYNPQGRRDPFSPIIIKEEAKAKGGDRPPLERYGVHEFKLVGVVWGGFGYNGMLEGPDGKGYFVHVGTIMGPNRGVVKKITQTTMVIEEKFKSFSGAVERKEIIIELRKKQEGMQ
jgi:type IV pilus assembly protein PilP